DFINLVLIPLIGYPGFPRPVAARNPWRPLGSHYGEGPRETVEKETAGTTHHLRRGGLEEPTFSTGDSVVSIHEYYGLVIE
ncbi:MAG: hypothetical protein RXQ57_06625, partial [Caldivirga sp.]